MEPSKEVIPLANRMARIGTESAYAVAAEAAKYAAEGKKIYPFHIGDLNFKSPPHGVTACMKAIDEGKTGYCAAMGIMPLREAIAEDVSKSRNLKYTADNVVITPGGKPVIFKFLLSVMNAGDTVLYPSPGYPIYESCINFFGGIPRPYYFKELEDGYEVDMEVLQELLSKDFDAPSVGTAKKILIFNNQNNPIGCCCTAEQLRTIARVCVENNIIVLSDEAYFDIVYDPRMSLSIASYPGMAERTVILYTFSKFACMTGWRLGAAIGPKHVIDMMGKITTNDEAMVCQFVQWAGLEILKNPATKEYTRNIIDELRRRRDALVAGLTTVPGFRPKMPSVAFYVFCNVTKAVEMTGCKTAEEFRKLVLEKTGVSFCTREHFGKSLLTGRSLGKNQHFVRFAYSGINLDVIDVGLNKLRTFMESYANKPKL